MTTLKESTAYEHKLAEETTFSQKLIFGEVSEASWLSLLANLYQIHSVIESRGLIEKPEVLRCSKLAEDLAGRATHLQFTKSTIDYCYHLETLSDEALWAHIYVHYLGYMFGGQFIKKKVKWSSNYLNFEDHHECVNYVREKTSSANHEEAKEAFRWIIKIYNELD